MESAPIELNVHFWGLGKINYEASDHTEVGMLRSITQVPEAAYLPARRIGIGRIPDALYRMS
jgi:hypothetical protein